LTHQLTLGLSRSPTLADGMDSGGDGVSKEELDAYYSYKQDRETQLANEKATMAASRAARAAENATIFETVPDFEARRGTHMRQLNTDQWGRQPTYGPRHDERTPGVVPDGKFAAMMKRKQNNTPVSMDKPATWLNQTPTYCHTPPVGWRKKSGYYDTGQGFYRGWAGSPKGSGMAPSEVQL